MLPRRDLLKRLSAVAAAAGLPLAAGAEGSSSSAAGSAPSAPARDRVGELLPTRPLGRTGERVTVLGLGGYHVGAIGSERDAEALIEEAMAGGIRFIDTAVSYQNGGSEQRFGELLVPKHRDVLYLMSKVNAKDARGTRKQLDGSLKRLGVDVIDLYQIHSLESVGDVDERLDNGVLDELMKARDEGKIRHIGFTGHRDPAAFHRMLDRLDGLGTHLDAAQMPMNVIEPGYLSYTETVLPRLVEHGYGVLAMKTLAGGNLTGVDKSWGKNSPPPVAVIPQRVSLEDAFGYVWSLPVASLISGMEDAVELRQNLAAASGFGGMTAARADELLAACADQAGRQIEYYKKDA
ncbi:aldo/keto reductase [Phycisphaera mikurensis]|uniref:Putative aldo/keto reductase n=1 Tax=Phycisphaera mikurensis (strain NBRC 102666 / KCTC 22515 / FYK2301M01) TaxID=1142394 RepID=I0IEF8_PHYMF|nr:aldo/keto reductase [Phycisphaera mikurensis]MBB6441445.1 aryl-alcohol dehydrogenase-like predicted oxidoreductase [Phycisphaera mikurensis]BAM03646.1 putative aldo/keto reductase [Phycisphaera mikurensis NBRC 102666]